MTGLCIGDERDLSSVSQELGVVLRALYESGDGESAGQLSLDELCSQAPDLGRAEILGALSILYGLGIVIDDDHGGVVVTSKYARFALGSLSEFLTKSIRVAERVNTDPHDREYMTAITEAMETARKYKLGLDRPLHQRDIVNIIIKGRQIRDWREKDVYLHVYHSKWQAYHLIGLGRKVSTRSIDDVAHRAMDIKLHLKAHNYALEHSVNPEPVDFVDISGSHGAITQYRIFGRVVKSFAIDLNAHLHSLVDDPDSSVNEMTFRWFTLAEVEQGWSDRGEAIMQSTPLVLRKIDSKFIESVAGRVDRLGGRPSILIDISDRVSIRKAAAYATGVLVSLLLALFSRRILMYLNAPSHWLDNLSGIMEIAGVVLSFYLAVKGWRSSS